MTKQQIETAIGYVALPRDARRRRRDAGALHALGRAGGLRARRQLGAAMSEPPKLPFVCLWCAVALLWAMEMALFCWIGYVVGATLVGR